MTGWRDSSTVFSNDDPIIGAQLIDLATWLFDISRQIDEGEPYADRTAQSVVFYLREFRPIQKQCGCCGREFRQDERPLVYLLRRVHSEQVTGVCDDCAKLAPGDLKMRFIARMAECHRSEPVPVG